MRRRPATIWFAIAATAITATLSGCSSSTTTGASGLTAAAPGPSGATSPSSNPTPTPTPTATTAAPVATVTVTATPTATAAASQFADGKTYYVWIDGYDSAAPTLHINVGEHLTGSAAEKYLTSHKQTIPPDGIPDDYINVDLNKALVVTMSATAKISINPEGGGPQKLTATAFFAWLKKNLAMPISASDRASYPGAPKLFGPLFAATFAGGTVVTLSQVFQP